MDQFEEFCTKANIASLSKLEVTKHFMWFHQVVKSQSDIDIKSINLYFTKAHLAAYPYSRLKEILIKNPSFTKSSETGKYKLSRKCLDELNSKLPALVANPSISITEKANLLNTPFIDKIEVEQAHKMAELYIILYCYENSVRKFIDKVLSVKYGENWWDSVKNRELDDKFKSRKSKEDKEKWVTSRNGSNPLFYLDWTDLVKLIRKEETEFISYVNEIKWVELRFEELERLRNVIAHNGIITNEDDFSRILLYFKDWCKQLK